MIPVTVTFDRTSLSLADLVVSNTPASSGIIIESYARPNFDFRKRYAPDADGIPGSVLLVAALEADTLPLTVNIRAASSAALETLKAEYAAALGQFIYELTLTEDGITTTYDAECSSPRWVTDEGLQTAYAAKGSVTIQLNPPGA